MDILTRTFSWVLHISLTASIMAVLIILILKLFRSHIGIRLQHALLFVIVMRLIIPINIQSNVNLLNTLFQKYDNKPLSVESKSNTKIVYDFSKNGKIYLANNVKVNKVPKISYPEKINYKPEKIAKESIHINVLNIASCIWLVGVISITLFLVIVILKIRRKTLDLEQLTEIEILSLMKKCRKKISINKDIPIYACNDFKTPCILGILKPKIYIPKYDYSTNNYEYIEYVLLHELTHYKRKDLFYNFIGIVALLIHWFNPIVWIVVKKMKLQRECACDAYILETLGEEKLVEYGMTLIEFSKFISSNRKAPQLAIFFETKSEIKRRIETMKKFKKGSYKMSAAAVICCMLAGGIVFTNSVAAKNVKSGSVATIMNNVSIKNSSSKFLIDAPTKYYNNLKRAEEIIGFKVKVPAYLPVNYEVSTKFQVTKVSNKDNCLKVSFADNKEHYFDFEVSKANMETCLKQIADNEYNQALETVPKAMKEKDKGKVEISKEAMNIAGIKGFNIIIKTTLPGDYTTIDKFFAWESKGVCYGIGYNKEGKGFNVGISTNEIGKIASSIKYVQDVKNVNYSLKKDTTGENEGISVYDIEDLKEAKELIGFNPKFLLNVNKDITIDGSYAAVLPQNNAKTNYELDTWYNAKVGTIPFIQYTNSKYYDQKKKSADSININGKEVFKYVTYEETENNKKLKEYNYTWQEKGFYCEVSILEDDGNPDQLAEMFVNSNSLN